MKIKIIAMSSLNDESTIQTWLDENSSINIDYVAIEGTFCYIFYTESV